MTVLLKTGSGDSKQFLRPDSSLVPTVYFTSKKQIVQTQQTETYSKLTKLSTSPIA